MIALDPSHFPQDLESATRDAAAARAHADELRTANAALGARAEELSRALASLQGAVGEMSAAAAGAQRERAAAAELEAKVCALSVRRQLAL